jgi:hypothetical protein
MSNFTAIRERYLRDELPIRLGGLAANLARIKSFSRHPGHFDAVTSLLNESKYFIEWTAPSATLEVQSELVELQIQLAQWQQGLSGIWSDAKQRQELADRANTWSQRVLQLSGLLDN